MAQDTAAAVARSRRTRRRLLGVAAAIAVVGAVFAFVLPRIADYRDVGDVFLRLGWRDGVVLASATVVNVVTFAPPWMATLPGLGFRKALALTQAATALSIISPAGAAVGMAGSYGMLRSWGFRSGPVGLAVAVTGVWNQFANLVFPIVALALLTAVDESNPALRTTASVGIVVLVAALVVFAVALSSERRARGVGEILGHVVSRLRRVLRKPPVSWGGASLARFRLSTLDLLRRRWHVITVATLVGHLTVFVLLLVCLRTVGVSAADVSLVEAFAAWALVRILGALPLTPAGLGLVELGLTGALVAFGASNADAVAVTLLYRFLTIAPTLGLGLLAMATWQMHDRHRSV